MAGVAADKAASVAVSLYDTVVYHNDIALLNAGTWINDHIVTFFEE